MQFAVGFNLQGETGHDIVEAEDALIAALKVKTQRPAALITYVRRRNKARRYAPPCASIRQREALKGQSSVLKQPYKRVSHKADPRDGSEQCNSLNPQLAQHVEGG